MVDVRCKICDTGTLVQQKKYRMSGPVVFIGYILLIPSILGVLGSIIAVFGTASSTSTNSQDALAAAGLAEGFIIFIGICFFVGGLLGWLLIMKKKVLRCNVCSATVNAE